MATKIIEQCHVAPSSGAAAELLLPLLYSDIIFLNSNLSEIAVLYTLPSCSESHFSDNIVPSLKKSLSLTLKHFTPLAGKIIFPLTTGMPISQYVTGDSISMVIAVSNADLGYLTGNLSRDADQFHDLVARLPPATHFPDFIKFSVAAIQVTLFPDQGISIGFTMHHAIGDGSIIFRFLHTWASITKFNGDDAHLLSSDRKFLSSYDRGGVEDADKLATATWDLVKMQRPTVSSTNSVPTHKVRATFALTGAQLQKLINFVKHKKPSLVHVSSFAVVCALVWTSLARSAGEEVGDGEPEYFSCVADCRARLNPPLPQNYFGNCLSHVVAESTNGRLRGDEGIVVAAEAIWEAIQKIVDNENGVLDGAISRLLELDRIQRNGNRVLWIGGSPKFDGYGVDFGWGSPKKFELVHIDCSEAVCLFKSGQHRGGVEIGLSMDEVKMDAFADTLILAAA